MTNLMHELDAMRLFKDIQKAKPGDTFRLSDYELPDELPDEQEKGGDDEQRG